MIDLMSTATLAGIVVAAMFVLGFIFSRLYQRSSKERAFVRTGLGGQKVIMDGGALKLPVFHELIWVNMNTLKLEVHRSDGDSLFTKDRMRVDVVAAFFVRVIPTVEGISTAAQTLGQRTLDPEALKALVEDKFVDALRAASVSMSMQELLDKRQDFIQAVQNAVAEDLMKNGLELESVSLTSFDQTGKEFFNPDNAFDAEGLTRLTEETQKRSKERNEIEQHTQVAIAQKNYEATQQKLSIEKNQRFATLEQQQQVATREAEQSALVAATQAQRKREAEQARIDAERLVKEAEVAREQAVKQKQIDADRTVQIAQIDQERATQIANQERLVLVAKKSEEQSQAEARANEARAEAVKAEQLVITAAAVAEAEREKDVELVEANKEAQRQAITVKVAAEAEKDAARNHADAVTIRAEANLRNYQVEAQGKAMLNDAINKLSAEQIGMQVKLALIQALPGIIAESVKPVEKIDGIKIVQVDGLVKGGGNGAVGGGNGGGSLADQAVAAALSYRAQQPIVDALLQEIGLKGGTLSGLTAGLTPAAGATALQEAPVVPPTVTLTPTVT
ncbi:MAG TPA: flotillin family protein, partial [Polyangiaceae bacterium]|nr:flotillin family protein [Polyangiaceae bacterium]